MSLCVGGHALISMQYRLTHIGCPHQGLSQEQLGAYDIRRADIIAFKQQMLEL
jgi:hypothetical protein